MQPGKTAVSESQLNTREPSAANENKLAETPAGSKTDLNPAQA